MSANHAYSENHNESISFFSGYSSFGTMLRFLRENNGFSQDQVVAELEPLLLSRNKSSLDRRIYGRLEKEERFPYFYEIELLFRAFIQLGVELTDADQRMYLQLAKTRYEARKRQVEDIQPEDWAALSLTLASISRKKRAPIHLLPRETELGDEKLVLGQNTRMEPHSTLRRVRALKDILRTDTSHLVERTAWLDEMLAYLADTPNKKIVVNQAAMGAGKSHALALLAQCLQEQYILLPYDFKVSEQTTADEQLAMFLSTLLADLQQTSPDETKQTPLALLIDQVFDALQEQSQQGKRLILLLDDVQALFESPREWPPLWEQFAQRFAKEPHLATMFLFTRIWPGWPNRRLSYIAEREIPDLSPQAGSLLWKRAGFHDVPVDLLEQASTRCGGNPQVIEMRAFSLGQRAGTGSFAWNRNSMLSGGRHLADQSSPNGKNANTLLIEGLLGQDSLFDTRMDIKARQILQTVITGQLSHPTVRVLECLALSPLGVPFDLLEQEFPAMDLALDELVRASLLDLQQAASQRAAIVPLAREAQRQALIATGRLDGVDQRVSDIYEHWLTTLQDFTSDYEKAALVAEMNVRYIRQRQLFKAVDLLIMYGWLCTLFGHIFRIQRVYEEVLKEDRGKTENASYEAGRLILYHRIAVHSGKKVGRDKRDQIYGDIYQKILAGELTLGAHTELEVLHNMLLFYNRKEQLAEAKLMFDQALERFQRSGQITPEVSALFAFDLGRLMSYLADSNPEAKKQYTQESVKAVKECIANWRLCLKNTLPLQEDYVQFKLARALNDLACDLRTLGQYIEAQAAIEESVNLKKKSGTPQHSIAIALSEYAQILAAQGKIRKALSLSEEARQILEQLIAKGDDTHKPELGLILKERADILLLQAHFVEAQALFEQAVELIGDKPLRQEDKQQARTRLGELYHTTSFPQPYQLDRRWFARFSDLVDYNDIEWLTQAGPFTPDEHDEWEHLSQQKAEHGQKHKLKIVAQSRAREAVRSREAQREPTIQYPFLALQNVRERICDLETLRTEIEAQESNAVVRRLYLGAVDDHLIYLRMCEAYGVQDQAASLTYNLQLYGKPSVREFKIALQQLCAMLLEARTHAMAGASAQVTLAQLRAWGLSPEGLVAEDLLVPAFAPIVRPDHALLVSEKKTFPTTTICRFFQDVLAMYGETDWNVTVSPARDHTSVDPNIRKLILPAKDFSVEKVRQLLAEEIEIHSYRAIAGRNSTLALLGSGLANHLAADEGLAYHYVQSVNAQVYGKYEEKRWNATLTTGFAAGVLTPALSFPELRGFLEKMFVVSELLDGATWEEAQEFAQQAAWRRCCRVFRGGGCLSLKDRVYLQGHLEISDYLARGGNVQRLYVGCIGVEHLEDMAELDILVPNHPHQQLALATDLADRLASYDI